LKRLIGPEQLAGSMARPGQKLFGRGDIFLGNKNLAAAKVWFRRVPQKILYPAFAQHLLDVVLVGRVDRIIKPYHGQNLLSFEPL
jgi:hypothetical protein